MGAQYDKGIPMLCADEAFNVIGLFHTDASTYSMDSTSQASTFLNLAGGLDYSPS
jgi:hypothetical protein